MSPQSVLRNAKTIPFKKSFFLGVLSLFSFPSSTYAIENILTNNQIHAVMSIITNHILNDTITHNGISYLPITSPYTGRIWLDRNLGANRVCTSLNDTECYGDYYQWGRASDGHQIVTSNTLPTPASNVNNVGHANYITSANLPYDWASTDSTGYIRQNNWLNYNTTSVCPSNYRVPTLDELKAELLDQGSAQIQDNSDAFNSFLKLPSCGYREAFNGVRTSENIFGFLWSVTTSNAQSSILWYDEPIFIPSNNAGVISKGRANGYPIRCVQKTSPSEIMHNGIFYNTVTSPYTGAIWLDRNLGAKRVCTSLNDTECYGDYYQWGRGFDGHQDKNSGISNTLALDLTSAGSSFIATSDNSWLVNTFDTSGAIRKANWTATDGTSICPIGFRVPTSLEMSREIIDEGVTDGQTAFENFLKIPSAGARSGTTGILLSNNTIYYWTDAPNIGTASGISVFGGNAIMTNISMSTGLSIRCIKD